MPVQLEKRVFTSDAYHRMAEAGIFSPEDRVELIEGEVIRMSPIGRYHAACVKRLNALLNRKVGHLATIGVQDPVRIGIFSEPQPDIVLLKPRDDFYLAEAPTEEDVLLLIEVADSSIELDREVKLPLYAKANITEVWIVSVQDDHVEVYSGPVQGTYQSAHFLKRGASVSSTALPSLTLRIEEILG
jgi:Uma2 family endonuclease